MESINHIDKLLFLFLNSFHTEWLDPLMLVITHRLTWIPLYVFIIGFIIRSMKWQRGLVQILLLICAVGMADYIASGIMKPFFERLRPCQDPSLDHLITLVGSCGGKYGFASSHAANSASLAGGLFFMFRQRWPKFTIWMICWALIVGYSRIYVGVHYPGDVLAGMFVGMLTSFVFCYVIYQQTPVPQK